MALALLCVCAAKVYAAPSRLSVCRDVILDEQGRQVFLWGVNVGEKSSARRHESRHEPEDFHNLRRWGMNAVRLLVFWSAIEPAPGQYDAAYLQSVDKRIDWAREAGLYVVLDMHQDLWSEAIPGGNGAPAWATLDDGLPHRVAGGAWSTAYFTSPRIHRAFDNFWANTPGPDGVGIQERFALAWQHLAARYADDPTVAGFDFMNEPFPGSTIHDGALEVWRAIPDIFRGASMPNGFGALLASLEEKPFPSWLLNALDKPFRHRRVLKALEPMMRAFERDKLMPMYRRTHQAIREVNNTGIIFLEPSVIANIGTPTSIEPLTDAQDMRDPLQAYMPHAYDIVVDTPLSHEPSRNRLDVIFSQKQQDARRLGMPLLIGEWGAFYGNKKTRDAARMKTAIIETLATGAFYWDYHRDIADAVYFESLARPQPLALAGRLERQSFDPDSGVFTCVWTVNPSIDADSVFAAPRFWSMTPPEVRISPDTVAFRIESRRNDTETVYVIVTTPDEAARITLAMTRSAP